MGCLLVLLIFVGLPYAEFSVMSQVAAKIGFWNTFFLLLFSVFFGTHLAKHQGAAVLARMQQCLAEGRQPTVEMVDGLLIFLGGVLFVFPGFISDAFGLLLIFPLTRWVVRWFVLRGVSSYVRHPGSKPSPKQPSSVIKDPGRVDRIDAVDAEVVE